MSNDNKVRDLEARKAYQNIKMGSFETLSMYSELPTAVRQQELRASQWM
jgi:hypothetical protein